MPFKESPVRVHARKLRQNSICASRYWLSRYWQLRKMKRPPITQDQWPIVKWKQDCIPEWWGVHLINIGVHGSTRIVQFTWTRERFVLATRAATQPILIYIAERLERKNVRKWVAAEAVFWEIVALLLLLIIIFTDLSFVAEIYTHWQFWKGSQFMLISILS